MDQIQQELSELWKKIDSVTTEFSQKMTALSQQLQSYVDTLPYKPHTTPTSEEEERMFNQAKGNPDSAG